MLEKILAFLVSGGIIASWLKNWKEKNDKRRETYKKVRKIIENIGSDEFSVELHRQAGKKMEKWMNEDDGYLLLKKYPILAKIPFDKKEGSYWRFNYLRRMLKDNNPQFGKKYSKKQLENFIIARARLLESLFRDHNRGGYVWNYLCKLMIEQNKK